jgi:SAM-dependent methyltransferase
MAMDSAWDQSAPYRHSQLSAGTDVTFSKVLLPVIVDALTEQENHTTFSVLDVGCGTGVLTGVLAQYVRAIVGIDPSAVSTGIASEHGRRVGNLTIERSDIDTYAKASAEEFDLAVAHMTLHTIRHLGPTLIAIASVLKPGGLFFFTVPHPCFWALITASRDSRPPYNIESPLHNTFCFDGETRINVPYYHRSLDGYSTALSRAGFSIQRLMEPFPSSEVMKLYPRPWVYPGFLFVMCRRGQRP